jgi:glycolate oxidase FAD binding subunit
MAEVAEPGSAEAFASLLAAASRDKRRVVIRGGGTKLDWARIAPAPDLEVRTAGLHRLIAHRYGDLTVTAQAGMRLADLNRELGTRRQWLPVESAFDEATIGGIVATNDSGPSRHRNGTPRDLLIGITLALTDGRVVKAGGHVVKNVAGYDLGKLVSGSFGTFAAIVDATFKLMPLPLASATLSVAYDDPAALARDVAALAASQLEPAAVDIAGRLKAAPTADPAAPPSDLDERGGRLQAARYELLVRFASSPVSTDAQVGQAAKLLTGVVSQVTGDAEAALWRDQVRAPWSGDATVMRMSWLPASLPAVLGHVGDVQQIAGGAVSLIGRAMGAGFLRIDGDSATHAAAVERLRAATDVRHVVVLKASPALKQQVDVWGPAPSAIAATRALKQMFDPAGILNAGRGPL